MIIMRMVRLHDNNISHKPSLLILVYKKSKNKNTSSPVKKMKCKKTFRSAFRTLSELFAK